MNTPDAGTASWKFWGIRSGNCESETVRRPFGKLWVGKFETSVHDLRVGTSGAPGRSRGPATLLVVRRTMVSEILIGVLVSV